MNVSIFKNIYETKSDQIAPIELILKAISNGYWSEHIQRYRDHIQLHGKDNASKELKKKIPYFTTSGIFRERMDSGLIEHSGLIAIDVDDLTDIQIQQFTQQLHDDPYTHAVFISCSGKGLCILVRIKPEEHEQIFKELEQYYISEHGITIDYLADISRPRFVSLDPDMYWNPESTVFLAGTIPVEIFHPLPEKQPIAAGPSPDPDLIGKAVEIIERKYQFIAGQRHTYLYNLARVANKYGISESELETYVVGRYDHFRENPSNAIKWVYRKMKSEFGLWQEGANTYSPPVQPMKEGIQYATRENPIAGSFDTVLNEHTGEIKIGETIEDLIQELTDLEIDWEKPQPRPIPVIALDGGTLCTAGNITTVSGYSKAGKSGVLSAIIAGAAQLSGDFIDTLGFDVSRNEKDKALIQIDTEQSRYDFDRNFRKTIDRSGRTSPPDWLHAFWFKGKDPKKLLDYTWALGHHFAEKHSGMYAMVIDGIGDYIRQLNDEGEAYELVQEFEKIAETFGCPMITVLHLNYGSDKQRGHLGSQLRRKSESVLSIKKETNDKYSKIEFPLLRNAGMLPGVVFEYNAKKGYHTFVEYDSISHRNQKEQDAMVDLAVGILSTRPMITKEAFVNEISERKFLTKAQANTLLKKMVFNGIILITPEKEFRLREGLAVVKEIPLEIQKMEVDPEDIEVPF